MPPDVPEAGSPADWLRHARSDLAVARMPAGGEVLPATLCFHAQQAAEKALKAVLVGEGIPFPRTHNLGTLLTLLPKRLSIPAEVSRSPRLTVYAVETRYPGAVEPVTPEEHVEAVSLADAVVRWAEGLLGTVPS